MISYSVRSCVVHVKYCNQLLAADMAGVACRGLWCESMLSVRDVDMSTA